LETLKYGQTVPMDREDHILAAAHSFKATAATTVAGVFCICVHDHYI
jgi:hypothetical protein